MREREIFIGAAHYVKIALLSLLVISPKVSGQGMASGPPPPPTAKSVKCKDRAIPQLTDITEKSGIRFFHTSAPESRYIIESMSGGVLLLDYDRDGWLDIYFTNAPTVEMALKGEKSKGALYHNNHDGTFTDVRNVLYHNNGDGTFTDVTKKAGVADGRWSAGAAFGDYDGDGFVDLMVANYVDLDIHNPPVFGSSVTCKYMGIDVQCGPRGLKGSGDSLFHNNGDGTFTDVSKKAGVDDPAGYYGLTTIWADFNNTGRPDIYVANDSTAGYLYRNDGNGKFTDIGMESGTALGEDGHEQAEMGLAVGDYLHTGRPALAVTDFSMDNTALYRNDGNWDFQEVSYAAGIGLPSVPWVKWGIAFVDLDNDGWLDLVTVSGHVYPQADALASGAKYREPKLVYYNQGDGTFCDASEESGAAIGRPNVSRGLAVGDLFNDGNMDLVVEELTGSPLVLRNPGIPGRHWVSFELAGTKSNRMAIGARLKIVAGGMTQTDEIHSGGSYISQSDQRVHFGLGKATKIDSLEIRWPSGKVETLKDLEADKFYCVLEGEGIVPRARILPSAAQKQ